jgi:hypothetical protein
LSQPPSLADHVNSARKIVERDVVLTEELVGIVIRASQLGFSPWRVGIALRVAAMELRWICAHLNEQDASTAKTLTATLRRELGSDPAKTGGRVGQEAPRR